MHTQHQQAFEVYTTPSKIQLPAIAWRSLSGRGTLPDQGRFCPSAAIHNLATNTGHTHTHTSPSQQNFHTHTHTRHHHNIETYTHVTITTTKLSHTHACTHTSPTFAWGRADAQVPCQVRVDRVLLVPAWGGVLQHSTAATAAICACRRLLWSGARHPFYSLSTVPTFLPAKRGHHLRLVPLVMLTNERGTCVQKWCVSQHSTALPLFP